MHSLRLDEQIVKEEILETIPWVRVDSGEKKWLLRFLNLMFGEEAVCPDGQFVPAIF